MDMASEFMIIFNAFQVALGLLFLSATAPTALTEERVRGSLDVLLSTPLSTRSIVLAKWWAVFRVAPRLAVLPGLVAFLIAWSSEPAHMPFGPRAWRPPVVEIHTSDRVAAAALPVAWVIAHGAAIASIGVALATWFARPGRAIAASVTLYLAATVVWIFAVELVAVPLILQMTWWSRGDPVFQTIEGGLVSFSPLAGQISPLVVMVNPYNNSRLGLFWVLQLGLLGATLCFAAGVLGVAVLSFNRCLGRIDEIAWSVPPTTREMRLDAEETELVVARR
jgi:ABC-type Na+ efflux pump permease subunit